MAKKYYRLDKILPYNCDYNLILGMRSNGKSYAIKEHCIKQAFDTALHPDPNADPRFANRFILLRRQVDEIAPSLTQLYFGDVDIEGLSNNTCDNIQIHAGGIWGCKYDIAKDKNKKMYLLGYVRSLYKSGQYKSGSYLDVENIIFEEFICENERGYLPNEPAMLQSFVSTIARDRKINVWMVGNTVSRVCPYFSAWNLDHITRQKIGTIECYEIHTGEMNEDTGEEITVTIAVELADKIKGVGKMCFGTTANMINNGAWQVSKIYPGLPNERKEYGDPVYRIVLSSMTFRFLMELLRDNDGNYFWYVSRKTTNIKEGTRIVADWFSANPLVTKGFNPLNEGEKRAFDLLRMNKIVYCDSLTAEEFNRVCKESYLL